jgi:hypothetical protein
MPNMALHFFAGTLHKNLYRKRTSLRAEVLLL